MVVHRAARGREREEAGARGREASQGSAARGGAGDEDDEKYSRAAAAGARSWVQSRQTVHSAGWRSAVGGVWEAAVRGSSWLVLGRGGARRGCQLR